MSPRPRNPLVVHWKREPHDVYIGRPGPWGNPFAWEDGTLAEFRVASREEAIAKYCDWLFTQPFLVARAKRELKGRVLGCWCAPLPCHGDVLVQIANRELVSVIHGGRDRRIHLAPSLLDLALCGHAPGPDERGWFFAADVRGPECAACAERALS